MEMKLKKGRIQVVAMPTLVVMVIGITKKIVLLSKNLRFPPPPP